MVVHDGKLWERVIQMLKTEDALTFSQIRKLCCDVCVCDLERELWELEKARRIHCAREWFDKGQPFRWKPEQVSLFDSIPIEASGNEYHSILVETYSLRY